MSDEPQSHEERPGFASNSPYRHTAVEEQRKGGVDSEKQAAADVLSLIHI